MKPALANAKVLVSHKEQVSQLPQDAKLLAASDFCPNSMYQIGRHIFCMQGHPEFRPNYSRDLINMRREMIGESTYESGLASLEQSLDSDVIATWIIHFLRDATDAYAAAVA